MSIYKKIISLILLIILTATLCVFAFLIIRFRSENKIVALPEKNAVAVQENRTVLSETNNDDASQLDAVGSSAVGISQAKDEQVEKGIAPQKAETKKAESAPAVTSQEMIKCKLKFDDDSSKLNINEVFISWNCTNYTGWECKLTNDYGGKQPKAPVVLPSGKVTAFCWWPTGGDHSAISWYTLKCTRQDGKIKKFEEYYSNYR